MPPAKCWPINPISLWANAVTGYDALTFMTQTHVTHRGCTSVSSTLWCFQMIEFTCVHACEICKKSSVDSKNGIYIYRCVKKILSSTLQPTYYVGDFVLLLRYDHIRSSWCTQVWFIYSHFPGVVNSFPPGQNGLLFADDIFRCICVNDKLCILIKISLKFVPDGPIDNKAALI